jgi:hypothetical protein
MLVIAVRLSCCLFCGQGGFPRRGKGPLAFGDFLALRIEAATRNFHEFGIKRGTARLCRAVSQDCDWPQKMFKIIFFC